MPCSKFTPGGCNCGGFTCGGCTLSASVTLTVTYQTHTGGSATATIPLSLPANVGVLTSPVAIADSQYIWNQTLGATASGSMLAYLSCVSGHLNAHIELDWTASGGGTARASVDFTLTLSTCSPLDAENHQTASSVNMYISSVVLH